MFIFLVPLLIAAQASAASPNVLFLFTDDQQHDSIRALGNERIDTPHTDSLANAGASFVNTYIMGGTSPAVCSPSRASLFSGRTLWNLENQGMWGFEISDKYVTMPQAFRQSGYATFATGKNEPGRRGHFARSFSHGDKILFKGMSNHYALPLHEYSPEGNYGGKATTLRGQHSAEVYAGGDVPAIQEGQGTAVFRLRHVSDAA
jgi:arylsulfatase A-like enzyme